MLHKRGHEIKSYYFLERSTAILYRISKISTWEYKNAGGIYGLRKLSQGTQLVIFIYMS